MDKKTERIKGVAYPDTWFTRDQIMALCGVSRWAPTEWGRRGLLARRPIEGKAYLYAVHGAVSVALLRASNRVENLTALATARGVAPGAPYEPAQFDALDEEENAQRVALAFETAPVEEPAQRAEEGGEPGEEEEARASAAPLTEEERGIFALFSSRGWRDLSRAQVARVIGVREELRKRLDAEEADAWIVAKLDKIKRRSARYHAGAVVNFLELDAPDAEPAKPPAPPPPPLRRASAPPSPELALAARALLGVIAAGADEIAQLVQQEMRERDGRNVIVFACRSAPFVDLDGERRTFATSLAAWESTVLKGEHRRPLRVEFIKRAVRSRAAKLAGWDQVDQDRVVSLIDSLAPLWLETLDRHEEAAR